MIWYHIPAKIEPRHQWHIEGTSGSLAPTPIWFFMARSSMRSLDQSAQPRCRNDLWVKLNRSDGAIGVGKRSRLGQITRNDGRPETATSAKEDSWEDRIRGQSIVWNWEREEPNSPVLWRACVLSVEGRAWRDLKARLEETFAIAKGTLLLLFLLFCVHYSPLSLSLSLLQRWMVSTGWCHLLLIRLFTQAVVFYSRLSRRWERERERESSVSILEKSFICSE